jgi:MFS family permease
LVITRSRGFFNFFKELDRRVKVTIASAGIYTWNQRLSQQYSQLYARDLGADPVELGLLSSIGSVVSLIVSYPVGLVTERFSLKKIMLMGFAFACIAIIIRALAGNWWILIPAIILGSMIRINALTDIIFINYTKPEQTGTVMGFSRTIWAIPSVFAPMIAAVIVTTFGGITAQGIRPLYYIQLLLAIFVFLFTAMKLPILPIRAAQKEDKLDSKGTRFIQDFRDLFKGEKRLKRWILTWIVWAFSGRLSSPFVPIWMVEVKGATPFILGLMGTTSMIFSVFMPAFAGRLADKIGRKKAYYILRPITHLSIILLIVAPKPEYLILVGVLSGIGQASFIPRITMHWEIVPEEKRGRWYGIEGFLNASSFPVSILGGILWQQGFMIEVLLLPILLEALIAIPILNTIPDTRGRDKR